MEVIPAACQTKSKPPGVDLVGQLRDCSFQAYRRHPGEKADGRRSDPQQASRETQRRVWPRRLDIPNLKPRKPS